MSFGSVASLALLAFASLGIACSDGGRLGTGPLDASYALQLHEDSATQYGLPECAGTLDSYCARWRPSTAVIEAILVGSASPPQVLHSNKVLAVDSGSFNLDSVPFRLQNPDHDGCWFLTMRLTASGTSIRGTWREQQDCHAKDAAGTVGGSRN